MELESCVPKGPVQDKWERHNLETPLINPANKKKNIHYCYRNRSGRGLRLRQPGGIGLSGKNILHTGFSKACPLHCRSRGH